MNNTCMDHSNKKIKINKMVSKNPTQCSIVKVGNKLTESCYGKKTCKIVNGLLECPGFDMGMSYGCIDDIGEDISGNIQMNIMQNLIADTDNENNNNINVNTNNTITNNRIPKMENFEHFEHFEHFENSPINNTIKNSISTRINNMNYNQSSENIKHRYERLSGTQLNEMQSFPNSLNENKQENKQETKQETKQENKQENKQEIRQETKQENKEEINIVKNQEESANTITMSEHEMSTPNSLNEITSESTATDEQSPILNFWNKYKFWIILSFILLLLIFIGILYFVNKEKKPIEAIEVINVNAETPSPTNSKINSEIKKIFMPHNIMANTSSDLLFKSSSLNKSTTPNTPNKLN